MNLHFIHGFLGFQTDWVEFKTSFQPHNSIYYSIEDFLPKNNEENYFKYWAKEFNETVFSSQIDNKEKNILIGYSLGGRLALHSLSEENNWDGAIIISANPGLSNDIEKEARIKNDESWGLRFMTEPWDVVIGAWNSQGVFSQQKNTLTREEKSYDRKNIYKIITGFSLGKQEDLRPVIRNLKIPLLWISGELDTKFALIGKEMQSINKNVSSVIIPNVGHRVPWESSENFKSICNEFLFSVSENMITSFL